MSTEALRPEIKRPEITLGADKVIETISAATGIPREEVCGLMMSDQDLDQLCDAILSRFVKPAKTNKPAGHVAAARRSA